MQRAQDRNGAWGSAELERNRSAGGIDSCVRLRLVGDLGRGAIVRGKTRQIC